MKYRKLRITWSVGWGFAALLSMMVWHLAYVPGTVAKCRITNSIGLQFTAVQGHFDVRRCSLDDAGNFKGLVGVESTIVSVPCWLTVALTLAIAAIPWLRYSLRTLLSG